MSVHLMSPTTTRARWATSVLRFASPRHRRWHRILASLTLDAEALEEPLEGPPARDFLICGCPRSGTTLLAASLYQPPSVVTVMEPWDALRLPPRPLFQSLHQELATTGGLGRGRLDLEALQEQGATTWCSEPAVSWSVPYGEGTILGVKCPGFWRYLPLLPTTKFLVCLRDPVETIRSFRVAGGRLEQGLQYDVPFNRELNDHLARTYADPAERRIALYDYVNERIAPHLGRPNVLVVRYERWFSERRELLEEIGEFLGVPVDDSPAKVNPRRPRQVDAAETNFIRERCRTATLLGYDG